MPGGLEEQREGQCGWRVSKNWRRRDEARNVEALEAELEETVLLLRLWLLRDSIWGVSEDSAEET